MGVYDIIRKEIICPKCEDKICFTEQIKWTNNRHCHTYDIGDKIDAVDGEYNWCTHGRPRLYTICKNCILEIDLEAIVNKGLLEDIVITNTKHEEKCD